MNSKSLWIATTGTVLCLVVVATVFALGGVGFGVGQSDPGIPEVEAAENEGELLAGPLEESQAKSGDDSKRREPVIEHLSDEEAGAQTEGSKEQRTPEEWRRFWIDQVEGTASGLLDGTVNLKELAGLVSELLEEIGDDSPNATAEDGSLVFPIYAEEGLGQASLHALPGPSSTFELRMAVEAPLGGWMPGDTLPSDYRLSFQLDERGAVNSLVASIQAKVLTAAMDPKWAASGSMPHRGGILRVGSEGATWSPMLMEFLPGDAFRNSIGEPENLHLGSLGSGPMGSIGSRLGSLTSTTSR